MTVPTILLRRRNTRRRRITLQLRRNTLHLPL